MMWNVLNESVHRHVYVVNKRVFKREETDVRSYARKNNARHAITITIFLTNKDEYITPIGQ